MKGRVVAAALERAKESSEENGCLVIRSSQLNRSDRELLLKTGWLESLIRGWYLLVRPDLAPGDSTPWYSSFWDFLRLYLDSRYGSDYLLSADSSLCLHTANTVIPQQVTVIVRRGGAGLVELPNNTSVYCYVDPKGLPEEREFFAGLSIMSLPLSLARVAPSFFRKSPNEARIALSMIPTAATLAVPLLNHELHTSAGRLVGALKAVGRDHDSIQLAEILRRGGLRVRPENPFEGAHFRTSIRAVSPYYTRLKASWESYRQPILALFEHDMPERVPRTDYLAAAVAQHEYDAYHSLSIEGYAVSPELIAQVESGSWTPESSQQNREQRDALAARGYYEAFVELKKSIERVFDGASPGQVTREDLSRWYQALWNPCVQAGLVDYATSLSYRRGPVFIRGSRHVPPPREALTDCMEALFECLEVESDAVVSAILGHYFFVYIHPYPDGNGRIARFLMNLHLASGGIAWCVIRRELRDKYFASLEQGRLSDNITPFARFLKDQLQPPMH